MEMSNPIFYKVATIILKRTFQPCHHLKQTGLITYWLQLPIFYMGCEKVDFLLDETNPILKNSLDYPKLQICELTTPL